MNIFEAGIAAYSIFYSCFPIASDPLLYDKDGELSGCVVADLFYEGPNSPSVGQQPIYLYPKPTLLPTVCHCHARRIEEDPGGSRPSFLD